MPFTLPSSCLVAFTISLLLYLLTVAHLFLLYRFFRDTILRIENGLRATSEGSLMWLQGSRGKYTRTNKWDMFVSDISHTTYHRFNLLSVFCNNLMYCPHSILLHCDLVYATALHTIALHHPFLKLIRHHSHLHMLISCIANFD